MAAVKDILRHVSTEVAGRKRKCYRRPNDHVITKGEPCLIVRDGPQQQRTYCAACAQEILEKAHVRLDEMVRDLATD